MDIRLHSGLSSYYTRLYIGEKERKRNLPKNTNPRHHETASFSDCSTWTQPKWPTARSGTRNEGDCAILSHAMTRPKLTASALFLCLATSCISATQASGTEIWDCEPIGGGETVTATSGENSSIHMTGQTNTTVYEVEGNDRRWNWGLLEIDDEPFSFRWSFIISDGSIGRFYDFRLKDERGMATSKSIYRCSKRWR